MENGFLKNLVKDFVYWSVYLHRNQGYLGRCVIWCKRKDALDLVDVTVEEQEELFLILRDLRLAVEKCFNPDWFNYTFLGNEVRHLHGHLVPRYAEPRTFHDYLFEDRFYGHHYKTDSEFITPDILLDAIKAKLITELRK